MEQASRVANPVSGRIDARYDERPTTTLVALCRSALAILVPTGIALAVVHAETWHWWWPRGAYVLVVLPLTAGAHGSWWRMSPWSMWHASALAQGAVLLVAFAVTILTLLVGAVLGVAALQLVQRLRGRRALS
ncbi:hypothetical protein [Agrococcus sp. HG114]|uniref:hypothetical protein n=1 Tax=Agrococcus sp. HG114 TaxID=2969757 RepID=UPI00215A136C|nr:hypothetical protein [Agrococcus sp. HG114]MCR8671179.1 hypothetical protein [Agrococcus sp. HG114]